MGVALLALWMLWAALAPTVVRLGGHAAAPPAWAGSVVPTAQADRAASEDAHWVEVCTASGSRWVWLGGDHAQRQGGPDRTDPPTGPSAHAQADCAWCLVGLDRVLPPTPAATAPLPLGPQPTLCAGAANAPAQPPHARPTARGPPFTA